MKRVHASQQLNKPQTLVIIGAGPTGLGAAWWAHELSFLGEANQLIILEQEMMPGGLASSVRDEHGFLWDKGGHVVFSHYDYFDKILEDAVEWNERTRASYCFMTSADGKYRYIPYPVQNNIHTMCPEDRDKCIRGLRSLANTVHSSPKNFDDWLLKNFGEGLCEIFMRPYNKKVWTVDQTEMNSDWVGERVAVPSVAEIEAKIAHYDSQQKALDSGWGPNRFFKFPRAGGTGAIWQAIAGKLPPSIFRYNHKCIAINPIRKQLRVQNQRDKTYIQNYDQLISTMPLDRLLSIVDNSESAVSSRVLGYADEFVFSHVHIIGIGLAGQPPKELKDKSWLYFPDISCPFFRVTVFSNYSEDHTPDPDHYWSLMCEVSEPVKNHKPYKKETLIMDTIESLCRYGFINKRQVVSKHYNYLPYGYPVPFLGREKVLAEVQPHLEFRQIYSRGRFGGWRYEVSNQDHSFMQGVEIVDFILTGKAEKTYLPAKISCTRDLLSV